MKFKQLLRYFCNEHELPFTKVGETYYLVQGESLQLVDEIEQKAHVHPKSMGVQLGVEKDAFEPTLAFLEMLAERSTKKVVINEKAEWLFLCGRDLMKGSVVSCKVKKGLVLVQNERDENLGLGEVCAEISEKTSDRKIVIKNVRNRGEYLGK